jgi:hypothetical protein
VLVCLLLVAASCAVGRLGGADEASSAGRPAPTSTVTVTVTDQAEPASPESVAPSTPSTRKSSNQQGSGSGTGSAALAGTGNGAVDAGARSAFTMTATVQGGPLLIGSKRLLHVSIANPNSAAITVVGVKVTTGTPNKAGCRAEWLRVGIYSGLPKLTVAAHGRASLALPIELVDLPTTNQNACQNAQFPLHLSGTART